MPGLLHACFLPFGRQAGRAKTQIESIERKRDDKEVQKNSKNAEEAERKAIAAAMDIAQQILDENATKNIRWSHFLKLGSSRERWNKLVLSGCTTCSGQGSALESAARTERLVSEALAAFKIYSGDSRCGAMTNFPLYSFRGRLAYLS